MVLVISLFIVATADAMPTERRDSLSHRVSVELRPAYNMVSHYAMRVNGRPLNSALSLHARYAFSFSPQSRLGQLYPTAYQGVGVAAYTFMAHKTTGTPMAAYIIQGARIADFGDKLSLGYEWNFGLSWGWHPNDAMSSRCNVMINVALPLIWRVAPHWELSLTPDYTHFSNGDTSFSNGGANLFGLRLGATYLFDAVRTKAVAKRYIKPSEEFMGRTFAQRMSYDVIIYGGWRADRFLEGGEIYIINEVLPIFGLNFQPQYHLNRHFAVGLSLDVQADNSLNLYDGVKGENNQVVSYSRPPFWQQLEVGVSARGEIRAPIFTIGVGVGINMFNTGYDSSRLYATFSLKAFLTKRLFLYVGYRFNSTQYTHNLMYGLGMRF